MIENIAIMHIICYYMYIIYCGGGYMATINVNVDGIQSAVLPGGSYGPTTTPAYPLWFFVPDKKETAKNKWIESK